MHDTHSPSLLCTIIIVTRARLELLRNCLKSIEAASKPFAFDVLIVGNGEEISQASLSFQPSFECRFVTCQQQTPAAARNFALTHAKGEYLCFLDDDVEIPPQYFESFSELHSKNPALDILGGPDRTIERAKWKEKAIGLTLHSPLATATTRYRHGGGCPPGDVAGDLSSERQLILCNLWMRKSLFTDHGHRFDERFMRNEENILLHELREFSMFYDPDFFVYHRRKTSLRDAGRAVFRSGFFRAKGFYLYPGSVSVEFFVPSAFLAYLSGLPFLTGEWTRIPFFTYIALNSFFATRIATGEREFRLFPAIMFYQFFINVTYGAGFLAGLIGHRFEMFLPNKRETQP